MGGEGSGRIREGDTAAPQGGSALTSYGNGILRAVLSASSSKRREWCAGTYLLQPEHPVIRGAVASGAHEIDVTIGIHISGDELVVHATLAARDVVPGPGLSRITRLLEPADTPQGIVLVDVAVTFTRALAVAPADDIQTPIAIDVRHLQTGHAVRRQRANEMRVPRVIDLLWLLQPGEAPGRGADDVESAILIEIRIL